jgi:hypothetical protein
MASLFEDEDCLLDYDEEEDVDSEEDLVFFLQDSDDDEEVEYVETPTVKERSPIRQLSPSLIAKMDTANAGRLKWVKWLEEQRHSDTLIDDRDDAEYPPIGTSGETTREKGCLATRWKKISKRSEVPVYFVKDEPSEIKFKNDTMSRDGTLCNYVLKKEECPFGDNCKFSHVIPFCGDMRDGKFCRRNVCRFQHPDICNKADKVCTDADCALYHLSKEQLNRLRGMKRRMCRNVLKKDPAGRLGFSGKCPHENSCKYAHSYDQIKEVVEKCKPDCPLVKNMMRPVAKGKDKKLVVTNTTNERCCPRLHPKETIINYVARTYAQPAKQPPKPKQ